MFAPATALNFPFQNNLKKINTLAFSIPSKSCPCIITIIFLTAKAIIKMFFHKQEWQLTTRQTLNGHHFTGSARMQMIFNKIDPCTALKRRPVRRQKSVCLLWAWAKLLDRQEVHLVHLQIFLLISVKIKRTVCLVLGFFAGAHSEAIWQYSFGD